MLYLLIALFGAAGCLSRYLVANAAYRLFGTLLPYGTLTVNVAGSLIIGLIMEASLRTSILSPELRIGLTVGFLGGFTTFSSFSYETFRLLEEGSLLQAGGNVLLNVTLCLMATWGGIVLARQI